MLAAVDENLSPTASSLMDIVREKPGIHFRGLARAADITSMGQLRHHVDRLRQGGKIVEVEDGRYKRYFAAGTHPPQVRRTLARFSRPVPHRIGKLLLWRPMSRAELRRTLGCADSTLGYHLARMSLHGDLVKTGMSNRCRYSLADPESVRAALLLQENGDLPPEDAQNETQRTPEPLEADPIPARATAADESHRPRPRHLPTAPAVLAARSAMWRQAIRQRERKVAPTE